MLPVVNAYRETTANKVVTVVMIERLNVSVKEALIMSLNFFVFLGDFLFHFLLLFSADNLFR